MNRDKSKQLWDAAQKIIPGGVNSPVRAFGGVGGDPVFVKSGSGACVTDADGNELIDYVMSWGALILGHANPTVVKGAQDACADGMTFGMPTEAENLLAALVVENFPSIEKVRMVSSGTEATMSAIRLARGYTGRDLVIKFEGCYHGHVDGLLAAAGSGLATFAVPGTKGIPASYTEKTVIAPYNNQTALEEIFEKLGSDIACIIVEPVAGNMGVVPPADGYLEFLSDITKKHGSLLLFDEVITGFRLSTGGAQKLFGVTPDLTAIGKIMGGGIPAAAYGGKAEIMNSLAPDGPVYQAGTLSGNPVAMSTGYAALQALIDTNPYDKLDKLAAQLAEGLRGAAEKAGVAVQQNRVGSMQTMFFSETPVTDYESAKKCDTEKYAKFFHGMLDRGIHFAPSAFEAAFVSTAHTEEHIDKTIKAAEAVMESLV